MPTTMERGMQKPRGRPPGKTSTRKDRTAKVDAMVLGWAELVARAQGKPLAEYISETLRGPVMRDYAVVMRQMEHGTLEAAQGSS